MEAVPNPRSYAVFVDEARDEITLEGALRCLREITTGRILLAFGSGEKTSGKQRHAMGRVAARYAQYVVLTSDNPGREGVDQICSALAQGLESAGCTNYHFQPNRRDAIGELIRLAQPGDVLLISGKGSRAYQELANTLVPFDDRVVAAESMAVLLPRRPRAEPRMLVNA